MKKMDAKQITLAALAIAVVCVSTMVIQIPIPHGFVADLAGCGGRHPHYDCRLYRSRYDFIWKCGLRSGTGAGTDDGGRTWDRAVLCGRLCV